MVKNLKQTKQVIKHNIFKYINIYLDSDDVADIVRALIHRAFVDDMEVKTFLLCKSFHASKLKRAVLLCSLGI